MTTLITAVARITHGITVVLIGATASAQSQAATQFEVASIKQWKLADPNSAESRLISLRLCDPSDVFVNPTGRITATAVTLNDLIKLAYGIPKPRIYGGPDWVNSERYIFEARAPDRAIGRNASA